MLALMKDVTGLLNFVGFCLGVLQGDKSYYLLPAERNLRVAVKAKPKVSNRALITNKTNFILSYIRGNVASRLTAEYCLWSFVPSSREKLQSSSGGTPKESDA